MVESPSSTFTILTLIVAPAVLTNASSVLALNTANRFGRVVDRSRQLVIEMGDHPAEAPVKASCQHQLVRMGQRAELLIRAQSGIYAALGLFVASALGAVIAETLRVTHASASLVIGSVALAVGVLASGALIYGSLLIIRETRVALVTLREELSRLGVSA